MSEPTRYPLSWPVRYPRTPQNKRDRARFSRAKKPLSVSQALDRLRYEIGLLKGADWETVVVSTNIPTRQDGLPYSRARETRPDPGVAVYFRWGDDDYVMPADGFDRVADNIAAIAGHIEADRKKTRMRVGSLKQSFAGFKALPAVARQTVVDGVSWSEVFGVPSHTSTDDLRKIYRAKIKAAGSPGSPGFDGVAYERLVAAWSIVSDERGI